MKASPKLQILIFVLFCLLNSRALFAETHTVEGVSGDIDRKHRGPSLSVNAYAEGSGAKILADAYVPNTEFSSYPIRFDFYINRRLFSSQIRSKELPGAIGVDVGSDVAPIPFNYTVVATLLHPNRQFVTTAYGVVYASNLLASFDCTLSINDSSALADDYSATEVSSTQSGNNSLSLSFAANNSSDDKEATVNSSLNINSDTASGSVTYSIDGQTKTVAVSGDITKSDSGALTSIAVSSSDEALSLDCE